MMSMTRYESWHVSSMSYEKWTLMNAASFFHLKFPLMCKTKIWAWLNQAAVKVKWSSQSFRRRLELISSDVLVLGKWTSLFLFVLSYSYFLIVFLLHHFNLTTWSLFSLPWKQQDIFGRTLSVSLLCLSKTQLNRPWGPCCSHQGNSQTRGERWSSNPESSICPLSSFRPLRLCSLVPEDDGWMISNLNSGLLKKHSDCASCAVNCVYKCMCKEVFIRCEKSHNPCKRVYKCRLIIRTITHTTKMFLYYFGFVVTAVPTSLCLLT